MSTCPTYIRTVRMYRIETVTKLTQMPQQYFHWFGLSFLLSFTLNAFHKICVTSLYFIVLIMSIFYSNLKFEITHLILQDGD